jgi:hypothetical protein
MWLAAADGTLFQVAGSQFTRPVRFASLVDLAGSEGMLAVLESDRLWIGPDSWQAWVFPGRTVPTALSASHGGVWMSSGSELLRFDGATWVAIEHTLEGSFERVAAHAGGAWIADDETICHVELGPTLRVEGVRPFARDVVSEYELRVRASDDELELVADVDGTPIELTLDAESGWLSGTARLETVGWHTISFASADASVRRELHVKRVPEVLRSWATDIEPIYQANCANSSCHKSGSSDPPDLGSLSAWTEHADDIRKRVVEARTMPPVANVGPDWGSDDIEIIQEWLEGGMLP